MLNKKPAFTLIELLVVIAIIGILATVSILSLTNARAKSRDAKRAGDMKQVQTALELFFNDNNRYPTSSEWAMGKIFSTSTTGTSTYMQIIPTASTPIDGACTSNQNTFYYTQTEGGNSYTISFCLGNTTGTLASGPKCLTPGGIVDVDCVPCGIKQVAFSTIAGHACNAGSPDYDRCVYDTVLIGEQCWLKQNMNVGDIVLGAADQSNNSILEKYCFNDAYGNCQTNGGLYQWDEAMQYSVAESAQGLCPSGWHMPTDAEWHALEDYLTDPPNTCTADRNDLWECANAGTKLKTGGTTGFEALFAGIRYLDGLFYDQGASTGFWSSTINGGANAWYRSLMGAEVFRDEYEHINGWSVRCLQD